MVRDAVGFIARTGPSSEQDRWEENPGVSPFSLAIAISALVAGASWLPAAERAYAESLADDWNERLEAWCYVQDTPLARELGVKGYYVRIARDGELDDMGQRVQLRNRDGEMIAASALVSMDFSYLVRLGLRGAHDARVQDTIKVVDRVLRVATPSGPVYHRYNGDGYGEHDDGTPFDGGGVGRAWPLLVGERGHLALQAGEEPLPYLQTIWNCASQGGLLPEQVWDAAPIPSLGLLPGRPSGSAMPLALGARGIPEAADRPRKRASGRAAARGGRALSWTGIAPRAVLPLARRSAGPAPRAASRAARRGSPPVHAALRP